MKFVDYTCLPPVTCHSKASFPAKNMFKAPSNLFNVLLLLFLILLGSVQIVQIKKTKSFKSLVSLVKHVFSV